jgi:signal transduction histidine kinase
MILTGFLASLVSDPVVYGLLISLPFGFMFCIYFSLNDAIYHMHLIEISTSIIDQNTGDFFYRKLLARKKRTLVTLLACLFPIFGVTYFLRMADLISVEVQEILFILAGVIAKVGFTNLACDAHQEVGSPAIAMLEAESNTNKARRAFLRYIFHEIRVPLNSFSMGVELLVDEGPNPIIIETLRESCTLMNSTLNDILSLQKIEEGSMRLVYKSFSLMDLINAVVMDAKDVADSNDVIIEIEVNNAPLPLPSKVFGDKFRLGHALRSLVHNAIKFGKSGKVAKITLTIDRYNPINLSRGALIPIQEGASKATSDLVIAIIQVVDKGPGIPSQNLERIFEPFLLTRPEAVGVTGAME